MRRKLQTAQQGHETGNECQQGHEAGNECQRIVPVGQPIGMEGRRLLITQHLSAQRPTLISRSATASVKASNYGQTWIDRLSPTSRRQAPAVQPTSNISCSPMSRPLPDAAVLEQYRGCSVVTQNRIDQGPTPFQPLRGSNHASYQWGLSDRIGAACTPCSSKS